MAKLWPKEGERVGAVGKIVYTGALLALLIPGMVMDFGAPGSTWVRRLWSVVEVYLLIQILRLIWRSKASLPGWFSRALTAEATEVNTFSFQCLTLGLLFAGFRLGLLLGFFGDNVSDRLDLLNPSFVSVVLMTVGLAVGLAQGVTKATILVAVVALTGQEFILWLAQDLFATRLQPIFFILLALSAPGKFKPRILLGLFGVASLALGYVFWETGTFQSLFSSSLEAAREGYRDGLESALCQAAYSSAGKWGIGLEFWPRLEFPRPGPLPVFTLAYLSIWIGLYGAGLYLVAQALFFSLLALESQTLPIGWPRAVVWAAANLMTMNLLLSVLAIFGFLGHFDHFGLPFVGSNQVGAFALVLTYFVIAAKKFGASRQIAAEEVKEEEEAQEAELLDDEDLLDDDSLLDEDEPLVTLAAPPPRRS
ncbi:MAG: hypothetical protein LBS60_15420 [Deltaproteobacteria bacterium]|nr:hypothetical protein [Deltaproteobacteria bacterium]